VYFEAFVRSTNNDDVVAFTSVNGTFSFARSFWTGNSHISSDVIYRRAVDKDNNVYISCDSYGTIDVVAASSSSSVLPSMMYTNAVFGTAAFGPDC
jgi:hypothetical protein